MPLPLFSRLVVSAVVISTVFFAGACSNNSRDDLEFPNPKQTPRPAMLGEAGFFENKVLVEVIVGRGFRPRFKRDAARNNRGEFVETYSLEDNDRVVPEEDEFYLPRMRNSSLPPVALRIRVTNQDGQPAEVEFVECRSYLGNFAVRPEKITIAAGESGEPEPMTSLLGVTGDEIPVTIGLRVAGKLETKVLAMRVIKTAPPTPKK